MFRKYETLHFKIARSLINDKLKALFRIKLTIISAWLLLAFTLQSHAQIWSPVGGGMDTAGIYAMTKDSVNLYAAGTFGNAGGSPAKCIAGWDGSNWTNLASGLGFGVAALVPYNGYLYAGGVFSHYILRWNGSAWSYVNSLATGPNFQVYALAVYQGCLYAGGDFQYSSGFKTNFIAKWNGTVWDSVGSGMNHQVLTLDTCNGLLYAGGSFTSAGGISANYIASWNGTSWSALGSGADADVQSLGNYNGNLIAGGLFTNAGGQPANYIAKWDGSNWSSLGSGMNGGSQIEAITEYKGNLYAGGLFSQAGGNNANNIAFWNGTAWSALGSGTSDEVWSLVVYQAQLYAGGLFQKAGGNLVMGVAKWDENTGIWENITDNSVSAFPNPSSGRFSFKFDQAYPKTEIQIYNILGENISTTLMSDNGSAVIKEIDLSNEPKGVYFYRLLSEKKVVSSGKLIVQ